MRGDTALCAQAPTRTVIARNDVRIEVLAQGERARWSSCCLRSAAAPPISIRLPSAARRAGYRVLRPQPRGIGQSRGPLTGIDLHDYAADVAAVIEHENNGAGLRGRACVRQPGGAHARHRPSGPGARRRSRRGQYRQGAEPAGGARGDSRQRQSLRCPSSSASRRCNLRSLRPATTRAPGSKAGIRRCWRPQRIAGDRTSREEDFAAGQAPILYLQPEPRSARPCGGRQGLSGAIRRPRHGGGDRARKPRGDRRAAGRRQRGADRLCGQALAGPAYIAPRRIRDPSLARLSRGR